jgi:hypothetical protein
VEWPGADSLHSGGIVNCIRGDASVEAMRESIDYGLWVKVNGIADGYETGNAFE